MMVVRPDFTYITSVRQPIGQFSPHQAVQHTARQFTMGPMQFQAGGAVPAGATGAMSPSQASATGMQGFGRAPSLWQRIKAKLQSRSGGKLFHPGLGGPAGSFYPYGPESWAGGRVVPMAGQRAQMLIAMGARNVPSQFSPITSGLGFVYGR